MPRSGETLKEAVSTFSETFPRDLLTEILSTPGAHCAHGHFQYPASEGNRVGNHLDSLFIIEPIAANERYVGAIVEDVCRWLEREKVEFGVIFAPAQPAVQRIAGKLAERTGARLASWEYLPSGWFGTRLVSGSVEKGDRVLVFNGVSQQGRCVGDRLPSFVRDLGGETVAAAVFAIGTAPGAKQALERYGSKLYATVQVDININPPQDCPVCARPDAPPLVPWTEVRDLV
jgi:hypothetical protein